MWSARGGGDAVSWGLLADLDDDWVYDARENHRRQEAGCTICCLLQRKIPVDLHEHPPAPASSWLSIRSLKRLRAA